MALTKISSTKGIKGTTANRLLGIDGSGSADIKEVQATGDQIADNGIAESKLQVSNPGSNGQFLQKQVADTGGMTWATVDTNLSSDTTPQLGGDVDTNDHNIEFKDRNGTDDANVLIFGAGDDMRFYSDGTYGYIQGDELRIGTASNTTNAVFTNTKFDFRQDVEITNSKKLTVAGTVSDSKGELRHVPRVTKTANYTLVAADAGKCITTTHQVTIPSSTLSLSRNGEMVSIINNSGSDIAIVSGSGMVMYNAADAATGDRTLAGRGMATIYFYNDSICYISGAGLS